MLCFVRQTAITLRSVLFVCNEPIRIWRSFFSLRILVWRDFAYFDISHQLRYGCYFNVVFYSSRSRHILKRYILRLFLNGLPVLFYIQNLQTCIFYQCSVTYDKIKEYPIIFDRLRLSHTITQNKGISGWSYYHFTFYRRG